MMDKTKGWRIGMPKFQNWYILPLTLFEYWYRHFIHKTQFKIVIMKKKENSKERERDMVSFKNVLLRMCKNVSYLLLFIIFITCLRRHRNNQTRSKSTKASFYYTHKLHWPVWGNWFNFASYLLSDNVVFPCLIKRPPKLIKVLQQISRDKVLVQRLLR